MHKRQPARRSARKPAEETPREVRERQKLTLMEVSQRCGLYISTIYRIERSGAWPTRWSTLHKLRIGLGLEQPEVVTHGG